MSYKDKMIPGLKMRDQSEEVIREYCEWRVSKDLGVAKGVCSRYNYTKSNGQYKVKSEKMFVDQGVEDQSGQEYKNKLLKSLLRKHNGTATEEDQFEILLSEDPPEE